MATDIVTLYNLALDKIGARATISLPTEQSREAEACNLWFPNIRDQVLASAFWPEATKMERLSLLAQQADNWVDGLPRPDYANSYSFPPDCLRPQYLSDYGPFAVQSYGTEDRAIMSNSTSPVLVYTFRQTQVAAMSPGLQMALVFGLAGSICESLTGKSSRAKMLIDQANNVITSAREVMANTDNEQFEVLPDWITARGYGTTPNKRYYYPFGSLLNVS